MFRSTLERICGSALLLSFVLATAALAEPAPSGCSKDCQDKTYTYNCKNKTVLYASIPTCVPCPGFNYCTGFGYDPTLYTCRPTTDTIIPRIYSSGIYYCDVCDGGPPPPTVAEGWTSLSDYDTGDATSVERCGIWV